VIKPRYGVDTAGPYLLTYYVPVCHADPQNSTCLGRKKYRFWVWGVFRIRYFWASRVRNNFHNPLGTYLAFWECYVENLKF
jgi:hypothetical protein